MSNKGQRKYEKKYRENTKRNTVNDIGEIVQFSMMLIA